MKLASKILFFLAAIPLFVLGLIYVVIETRMLIAGDFQAYSNPGLGAFVITARLFFAIMLLLPILFRFLMPKTKFYGSLTFGYALFLFIFSLIYKFATLGQTGIDNYLGIAFIALTVIYLASEVLQTIRLYTE